MLSEQIEKSMLREGAGMMSQTLICLRALYVRTTATSKQTKRNKTKRDERDTQKLNNRCVGVRGCSYTASSQSGTEATTGRKLQR